MGEPTRERLTGREQELSALRRSLDALAAGRPGIVAIHGEPGIGKTRLLSELAALADSRGIPVLFPEVSRQWNERTTDLPGAVLAVDDAHGASGLDGVLRAPPPAPVLLAVAYRDGCLWLPAALARSPWPVTRLPLGPLGPADVPGVPTHQAALLVAASAGNPLFLRALGRVGTEVLSAITDPRRLGETPLPDHVLAVATDELDRLPEAVREVAFAVATAGTPADVELVVRVAGLPESVTLRALDELVAYGLVTAHGSRLAFRHPLVRAATYQAAGVRWRTLGHRRAGEYLRAHGGPLPLRAFHAARTAGYGDIETAETLAAGAAAVLETAPATAAAWVGRAVEVLPDDRVGELLPLLGRALSLCGDLPRARDVLHTALALDVPYAVDGDPRRPMVETGPAMVDEAPTQPLVHKRQSRVDAVRACARTERLLGRYAEAKALLEREPVRGLAAERATVALLTGETGECVRLARQAVVEGDEVAGHVLGALGAVRGGTDTPDLGAVVRLVDGLPDASVGDHLSALGWLELESDRLSDAGRHLRRGLDFARATGRRSTLPTLLAADAALAVRSGHLDRARVSADEGARVARELGSPELVSLAATAGLPAVLWQMGPEEALASLPEPRSAWLIERVGLTVAECLLATGDASACVDHVRRRVGSDLAGASGGARSRWAAHLAVGLAESGREDEALPIADDAVSRSGGAPHAHHARSLVLARLDELPAARDAARLALRGTPLRMARVRELLAEHLAGLGELTAARAELGRAKEAYLACSAAWLSIRIRTTEARLGARAPRPRRPLGSVEALSGRELEIAELVAAGLTNREVATRLYLSRKTVEGHLARVFTKLGVKSRIGVAQRLAARPH
ncbi:LuxR C-terminal-related transcriptional regulator [Actinokineospora enzanensis]|uniref:LuxR C-terminal-related transcriptional regulator n=1 Tax=Actinokineospora enzanensis TaxID=155975 RepID=UPI000381BE8A|nr:LuxR family transcriptional regulator [Actinokineospora enzanensis]